MKKLIFIFLACFLFANSYTFTKNILGEETFNKYENLIKSSLEENASLKQTLIFLNNTSNNLKEMGYLNFYPIKIHKNKTYSITLEMKSQNYIDPLILLNQLNKRGCNLTDIKKTQNFIYYISCPDEKIINTYTLTDDIQILHNITGIYWIDPGDFTKINISTSKYDFWHPYIVFYDTNLNILNIISSSDLIRKQTLNIPEECKYIKITDAFTKENIKRGIFIKGLK